MIAPWSWDDLFPDEDYGFHFKFKRESLASFYARPAEPKVLEHRAALLREHPDWIAAFDDQSPLVLREACTLLTSTGLALSEDPSAKEMLHQMGTVMDADLVMLRPEEGRWLVSAGVVCFPSGWSLPEKLGKGLEEIHDIVPGLNSSLGERINKFIAGLKPGYSWERLNWGLSATDQLSMHPNLKPQRLTPDTPKGQICLRLEMQSLTPLPETGGLLFGIRILNQPLSRLMEDNQLRGRFERALRTMPEAVAVYKGLGDFRQMVLKAR